MVSVRGAEALLTPVGFISKWKSNTQTERQIAQAHFNDLCRLLGHPTPAEDDPSGDHFAFEKLATKIGGGKGYADVWKKNHFAWEYKSRDENLDAAHKQLITYAPALGNPPLQVVSDFNRYRIYTSWTNTVPEMHEILLDEFVKPDRLELLRNVFHDPDKLKPVRVRSALTKEAADKFATIAFRMEGRETPEKIAHFVNQLVFCFFADSVGLLPKGTWSKLLARAQADADGARSRFNKLFAAMQSGDDYGAERIVHFNGGLFDGQQALPLDEGDIGLLRAANTLDWSQIDPSIFGSLFERFLDPQKRAQIGAHYTDAEKIQKIIEPVILRPLHREWDDVKADIKALLSGKKTPPMRLKRRVRMKPLEAAEERRAQFLKRLQEVKILDPACGSGNFLYLALQGVKDLEHHINLESERMGLKPQLPFIGPEILKGIELNPVAAELARTTIWIGDIQWRMRNGIHSDKRPVLEKLDTIVCGDALLSDVTAQKRDAIKDNRKGRLLGPCEADWPDAEFIVGNPPFLGGKLMRTRLGSDYVDKLFDIYEGRVPRDCDLVTYWFDKARAQIEMGESTRAGFVATNSIRGGANRLVLNSLAEKKTPIFEAWSDEPWVVDGAAVRVSLVCFGQDISKDAFRIDGKLVDRITTDLRAGSADLTVARKLAENREIASNGISKKGKFEIDGELARSWLTSEFNPNSKSNRLVLSPWRNGEHVTRFPFEDKWIVNFSGLSEKEASEFHAPFELIKAKVKPFRANSNSALERKYWWRLARPASGLFASLSGLRRYVVTPEVSKHRVFTWFQEGICPDKNLIAIARDDDTSFGILHSRFHEIWALKLGTSLEDRPRYTCSTTFSTFPFPEGLTPNLPSRAYAADPRAVAIAKTAKRLNDLRNAWLNPPDLIDIIPEVLPGYPDRMLPKSVEAAAILKTRTLTNLYNERPQWLADAHSDLDAAVAAAYGWAVDISEDDALARLLELNLKRVAA